MIQLIDLCWVLTNTVSLFLFTLDVILMCWIKFAYFTRAAAWAATAIMAPVLVIILVFGVVFYRKIVNHQYDVSSKKCDELERMREQLDKDTESLASSSAIRFPPGASSLASTRRSSLRSASGIHNV
jgi:lysylphosphatidylglycerol synthetase-like protein (DUF2156 family)